MGASSLCKDAACVLGAAAGNCGAGNQEPHLQGPPSQGGTPPPRPPAPCAELLASPSPSSEPGGFAVWFCWPGTCFLRNSWHCSARLPPPPGTPVFGARGLPHSVSDSVLKLTWGCVFLENRVFLGEKAVFVRQLCGMEVLRTSRIHHRLPRVRSCPRTGR